MKFELAAALVAAGLAIVPVAGHAAAGQPMQLEMPKEIITDSTITGKIKAEFAKDKALSAANIRVDALKGVVKLSGEAKSKADVEKAGSIARNTAGVSLVNNEIRAIGR